MSPILLTFCWTGYLNTPSLHQGKIDLEKNYRGISCPAQFFSPAVPWEAHLRGAHAHPVAFGLEGVGWPQRPPGVHTAPWAAWG